MLAWLCDEVVSLANSDGFKDDAWIPMMASCTWLVSQSDLLKLSEASEAIQCWNGL